MDSIVTKYKEVCIICGRETECEHHLVFGTAGRELSEKDGLKVPMCDNCHNMGEITRRIHGNSMAERLSKMLGQAIWEKEYYRRQLGLTEEDEARQAFLKRYGHKYM